MSAVKKNEVHQVIIGMGSNISPTENLPQALSLLSQSINILKVSSAWITHAVGSPGPDFLNAAVLARTSLNAQEVKNNVLQPIEASLGRVRTCDPNSPRTIDLDILIFDGVILDQSLWEYPHTCVPVAEILPEFVHPITTEPLNHYAKGCLSSGFIEKSDLKLHRGGTARDII